MEESGTLSTVEGRGSVSQKIEESSEEDSKGTEDDSDAERSARSM